MAGAIKPIRYALYYRDVWDRSVEEGGITTAARLLMDCVREACANKLEDVYKKNRRRRASGGKTDTLFQDFESRLVFRRGPDQEAELVARLGH